MRNTWLGIVCGAVILSACTSLSGSGEVSIREHRAGTEGVRQSNSRVLIRVADYADGRDVGDARKLGVAKVKVVGLNGSVIRLDRDVGEVVAESMSARLEEAGLVVLARDDAAALYELSGIVRELSFDVKGRDYVAIRIESTLKEIATGKVVWAGEVEQREDRFAGVSGNTVGDIAEYLQQELAIATGKTVDSIKSTLVATRSDLFNVVPGAKVIDGVKVFATGGTTPMPDPSSSQPPAVSEGQLVVRTEPGNAKIYLDGVYYGLAPLSVPTPAGVHLVEAKLKGYRSASERVAIRVGTTTELELQLEP